MSLAKGDHLGPYEIVGPVGAGGMGEVYRARDAALDRDVAIKVLPAALAQHPERLARFDREAKVLAALNHPNIAAIYGLESRAIVMELVEGPTLADRIHAGAIPLDEALRIAMQIADALEAAHEKGVVHRDLKPANVKVREDGTVKVLDFGLATAAQAGGREQGEAANSPTLTMGATEAGTILGTASYMSPEQAAGKPVDRRADIWSFGVVLWEMLTARRLFQGETVSHTLADVLRSQVDLGKLPASTPAPIRELMKRCLDRDVKTRLRDIGEARVAIQKWIADPKSGTESPAQAGSLPHTRLWKGIAAGCAVAAFAFGLMWYRSWSAVTPLKPLVRLDVDLGPDVLLSAAGGIGTTEIISPDGNRLVYVSRSRLYTRTLDQSAAVELSGTEGAYGPFFSPDGQSIAFFSGGKLKKISVGGGTPIPLCDAANVMGGSWGEDGSIIAPLIAAGPLMRIPSGGGTPVPVTELAQGEATHRWPQILPGGRAVLFTAHRVLAGGYDAANIQVKSLPNGRTKTVHQGGTFGRYLATSKAGYLTYLNRGTMFAVPFDLDRLEERGTPVPLLDQVANTVYGSGEVDVSRNGTLVYRAGSSASNQVTVQWMDSSGKLDPLIRTPGAYGRPSLSPDGEQVAVEAGDSNDIWVWDRRRENMTKLTTTGSNLDPVWTPDGHYLVFQVLAGGTSWIRSDGGGKPQTLTQSTLKKQQWPWSFTRDGKRLAYFEGAVGGYDLWTVPIESDPAGGIRAGKPEVYQTGFDMRAPAFSPDGQWLAYASNGSGQFEIYVRAFPDKDGREQISNGGGSYPMWSRTAHELLYETLDNHIMVASYSVKGDSLVWEKPRLWSEKSIGGAVNNIRNVDLAPDGKHIVALMPAQSQEAQTDQNHITFLLNFFDEVQRRAGGAGK